MIELIKEVELGTAFLETIYMVFTSCIISYIFALPIGVIAKITKKDNIWENKYINFIFEMIINLGRSIPFIILLVLLIPFTRFLLNTSYGNNAAIVSLTISCIPFVARLIENSLEEVDDNLVKTYKCMGASNFQIITRIYLTESLPSIIRTFSLTLITLIGYSAMAGTIGGGGLGNVAYMHGFQRFRTDVMLIVVIVLVILVQVIQYAFNKWAKKIDKR